LFQFENSVAPMYEMIKKNEDQSRKLAQLRDVLLSKLMSGEIDVSNLDL
jgi:type I restriction enzyme S subunit